MARRNLSLIAALALLVSSVGCIEFERQVMTYRYDQKTDTLLIFQDYQGIYGADNPAKLADIEASQFQSVLAGGRTFFFANWIFEINLKNLRDAIVDLPDRSAETVAEDELNLVSLAAAKVFWENCKIENGALYLNSQKRLSGVQRVQISNLRKILPAVEEALKAYFKAQAGQGLEDLGKQQAFELVSRPDWKFIELNGNRIVARFPMSAEEYRSSFEKNDGQSEYFRKLKTAGIDVRHSQGIVTIAMGRATDKRTRISFAPYSKDYRDNLLNHLQKQGAVKIRKSFDSGRAAREFLGVDPK